MSRFWARRMSLRGPSHFASETASEVYGFYHYNPMSTMPRLTVASDGSGETGGGAGGWGWATEDHRFQWGGDLCTTHQAMELTAVLKLLHSFPSDRPLLIQTDSLYVFQVFKEWLPVWRENGMRRAGGKPVAHRELIEAIEELLNGRDVCWKKVKGHSGHALNDIADRLAGLGRIMARRLGRTYCFGPISLTDPPPSCEE